MEEPDTIAVLDPDRNLEDRPWPKPAYAWYVIFILMITYIVSLIDRQILTLLIHPIRSDLDLSDTEVSLLIGFAFAVFFTVMGVPIATLADRKSRKWIISIGIVVWSVMTALCGLAKSFTHLFAARIGVGVGEAALTPSAYSMIADYFPPQKLARAISVYSMGLYLGAGIALLVGSVIIRIVSEYDTLTMPVIGVIKSWQLAFFIVGLPGLFIVLLMICTVKEPVRRGVLGPSGHGAGQAGKDGGQAKSTPRAEVIAFMRMNWRTLGAIFFSIGSAGIASIGFLSWIPEFFRRTYAWDISDAGFAYGICLIIFGGGGALFGGWLSDHLTARGMRDAPLRVTAWSLSLLVPFAGLTTLMPTPEMALICLAIFTFLLAVPQALTPTAIQLITPNQMRAQVTAVYLLIANFIVIGCGPTFIALFTDFVFRDDAALRYSLSIVSFVTVCFGAFLMWRGLRHFRDSLDRSERWLDT